MNQNKIDDKKFHNYSLAFHQKQSQLSDVSNRAKVGFHNFQRHQKILKPKTIDNFQKFTVENKTMQKQYLKEDSEAYIDAFFDIIRTLNTDRDLMQFVLPTLDAILTEERAILRDVVNAVKATRVNNILVNLKHFLSVDDHRPAAYQATARIIATIYGQLPPDQFFNQQKSFLLDLLQMARQGKKKRVSQFCLLSCLVHLNKHEVLAEEFLDNNGAPIITNVFDHYTNEVQLIYYAFLNIWVLSFVKKGVNDFISIPKLGIIRGICQVLQKISRQKLIRIAFAIFKNISGNQQCLQLMIDNKLLKIIDTILKGNIKEGELSDSVKEIGEILQSNIRVLSSFQKYCKEVNAQMLTWSSVHTERFWKQNALKFEANDYIMIHKLKKLLSSKNELNQAIACYDLGQFCRFYPRGREVLQAFKIKQQIMEKARYGEHKSVKQQALLALQKIMIQNWQGI